MKPTLLQYPDFNKEFCITTDASKQACGAVLTQDYNNTQLPIAYYMMDVDELRAVQTSGPTTPSTCLLRAGPFYQFGQKIRVREEDTKNK